MAGKLTHGQVKNMMKLNAASKGKKVAPSKGKSGTTYYGKRGSATKK